MSANRRYSRQLLPPPHQPQRTSIGGCSNYVEKLLCYWEKPATAGAGDAPPSNFNKAATSSMANGGDRDQRRYLVYWQAEGGRLGVTDFGADTFEAQMDRKERQRMLKNIAEDLVDGKWRRMFNERGLKVGAATEESIPVRYISATMELPRIEESEAARQKHAELVAMLMEDREVLKTMVGQAPKAVQPPPSTSTPPSQPAEEARRKRSAEEAALDHAPAEDEDEGQGGRSPRKRAAPAQSTAPPPPAATGLFGNRNRRPRGKATGARFCEDEGEGEEEVVERKEVKKKKVSPVGKSPPHRGDKTVRTSTSPRSSASSGIQRRSRSPAATSTNRSSPLPITPTKAKKEATIASIPSMDTAAPEVIETKPTRKELQQKQQSQGRRKLGKAVGAKFFESDEDA